MYPGLVSCPFYAIPIYPFKFMKFFIYLLYVGLNRMYLVLITLSPVPVLVSRIILAMSLCESVCTYCMYCTVNQDSQLSHSYLYRRASAAENYKSAT